MTSLEMDGIKYNVDKNVNYRIIEKDLLHRVETDDNCGYTQQDVKNICTDVYDAELKYVFGVTDIYDKTIPDTIKLIFDRVKTNDVFFAYFKNIVCAFGHLGMEYDDFLHATCTNADQVNNLHIAAFSTLFSYSTFFIMHKCIVEMASGESSSHNIAPLLQELLDETVKFWCK
jgi:hypothetical protein